MQGRFPIGKPKFPSWGLPMFAVAVAIWVHLLWLVIPQFSPEVANRQRNVRLYAYPNLDARVWSPTLFSLPSSMGFSGAIRQNTSNVLPPLKSPLRISQSTEVQMDKLFSDPVLRNELPLRSNLPVSLSSGAVPKEDVTPVYAWHLQALDDPGLKLEINRLPDRPDGGGPVVLTGSLDFDRSGQVQSLILDQPVLLPDLRSQVIRALRRVRQPDSAGARHVRFRFAYVAVDEEQE